MKTPLEQQLMEFYQHLERQEASRGWRHVIECLMAALFMFLFSCLMLWLTARQWLVYPTE